MARTSATEHCEKHATAADDLECVDCTIAQQNAAAAYLTTAQKAKRFTARRRKHSVTAEAQPVQPRQFEFHKDAHTIKVSVNGNKSTIRNNVGDIVEVNEKTAWATIDALKKDGIVTGGEIHPAEVKLMAELQQPLATPDGEPFVPAPGQICAPKEALEFMLAGNAYFTLRSKASGTRYTYRVSIPKNEDPAQLARYGRSWFAALLSGPNNEDDYTYLGVIDKTKTFKLTRSSRMRLDSPPIAALVWLLARLTMPTPRLPSNIEMWHEGRCGRCGRKLTVPESVAAGIGPECASRMEGGF